MGNRMRKCFVVAGCASLLGLTGCSGGPMALKQASIDADASTQRAMEAYDKNGDGFIAGEELDLSPAIKSAMQRVDVNGDGQVSAEEVQGIIENWLNDVVVVMAVRCEVTLDDEPLDGATVTFDPEPFLGNVLPTATGVTAGGKAKMVVPQEQRQDPTLAHPNIGMYLVRISKIEGGQELIPARYNTNTTLGIEVARRAVWMPSSVKFDLTSN